MCIRDSFSKQRKMMSKTDSTTDADCRLDSPCAATALTRSFLVTVKRHLLRGLLVAPRDVRLVALRLELLDGGPGLRHVGERADPYAVQRLPGTRGRRRRRRGCRGRGSTAGTTHLHLETIDRKILGERDGVTQRQARLDDHGAARRLGGQPLG